MKKIIAKIYLILLVLSVIALCVYGVAYADPKSGEFIASSLVLGLTAAGLLALSLIWAFNQLD